MKIGDTVVVTPFESAANFDLNWRINLAQALATRPTRLRGAAAEDADVRLCIKHLAYRVRHPLRDGEPPLQMDGVLTWESEVTGRLVSAYLITPLSCPQIADELELCCADIELYEKLVFNIRSAGRPRRGVLAGMRVELSDNPDAVDALQAAALRGGVEQLRAFMGSSEAPAVKQDILAALVEREIMNRLAQGRLTNSDLIRLESNAVAKQHLALQRGDQDQPAAQANAALRFVLSLMAPRLLGTEKTEDQVAVTTAAIQARFDSQRQISATRVVDDRQRGLEALNRKIDAQFGARKD